MRSKVSHNHISIAANDRIIARLSKKAPGLLHAISGSLKIKKLQAIENQKMIEFGVFRQPQQVTQLFGKILNHNMLGIAKRQGHF